MALKLTLDGKTIELEKPELLIDLLIRRGAKVRRIQLRFMRSLCDRLPLQCADGKVDAGSGRVYERTAEADFERHDRPDQGHRDGYGLRDDSKCLGSRVGHARIAHLQNEDRLAWTILR